jgi:hypothetical protein
MLSKDHSFSDNAPWGFSTKPRLLGGVLYFRKVSLSFMGRGEKKSM